MIYGWKIVAAIHALIIGCGVAVVSLVGAGCYLADCGKGDENDH
jgi:hypothetical protein